MIFKCILDGVKERLNRCRFAIYVPIFIGIRFTISVGLVLIFDLMLCR